MHSFRELPGIPPSPAASLVESEVRRVVAEAIAPRHFYISGLLCLEWQHREDETVFWELLHGRLLDPAFTRRQQTFEAWNVYVVDENGRSAEPLLSLKLDWAAHQLHVVRAIYSYAWEGYHDGGNVYRSRETRKWVRELIGTIYLDRFNDPAVLRDEIICQLFHAVIGTSRLPLTSVESPVPAFSLGQLLYCHRGNVTLPSVNNRHEENSPMRSHRELLQHALHRELCWLEKVKVLEAVLRAMPAGELPETVDLFVNRWHHIGHDNKDILPLLRSLFNHVSLSPYTDFVDKTIAFLKLLAQRGHVTTEVSIDFLGYLLRQICRHLTAFDLTMFHHRGANYPDALLLDTVLKAYLDAIHWFPDLFLSAAQNSAQASARKRIRRRALRQGWLLRSWYEGQPVPDAPTSEGENVRILPPPHVRVPDEQIYHPHRRSKQLYSGDPLSRYLQPLSAQTLRQSIDDLAHADELRELGMAIFLDRPLDEGKAPGQVDQTPLLSYEAFSRSLAARRLIYLKETLKLLSAEQMVIFQQSLQRLPVAGMSVETFARRKRTGVISLGDVYQVAADFVLLRTTRQSAKAFLEVIGPVPTDATADVLIVREARPGLIGIYDTHLNKRMDLEYDPAFGYERRGGVELPRSGFLLVKRE